MPEIARANSDLFLGFDASCGDCASIAGVVQKEAGDRIEVMSLRTERMEEWRRSALGEDAPWAPTLVRVTGGEIQAWTGWQIGPALARYVSAGATLRILASLGGNALNSRERPLPKALTRRTVVRGGVGAFVGWSLLMNAGAATAAARQSQEAQNSGVKTLPLHGDELLAAAAKAASSVDFSRVASAATLTASAGTTARAGKTVTSKDFVEVSLKTGLERQSAGRIETVGSKQTFPDGSIRYSIGMYNHDQKTLIWSLAGDSPINGIQSDVQRYHVVNPESKEPKLELVSRSINGADVVPVPEGTEMLVQAKAQDPCGGCNLKCGPGNPCGEKSLNQVCTGAVVNKCIYSLAGCGACLAACGGGASGVACVLCAIANCPGVVSNCCPGRKPACIRCVYPT